MHKLWEPYPLLKNDLKLVEELINKSIRVKNKKVEATIKRVTQAGGKKLRPAFALLCANIGPKQDDQNKIAIGAALETLHMATLVHDDVIDEAEERHGVVAMHATNDNKYAIYAGDYLFCVCFTILSQHSATLGQLEFNAKSMERILTGELDQLEARFTPPLSVKSYLSRVSGKTAQLFAVSCYSGALVSEATRRQQMIAWNFGHYIGMAFQIMDDILDYTGKEQIVGKPVLADVRQGIYTLPLIYARRENPEVFDNILTKKEALTENDIQYLTELIEKYNGVEKARELAKRYTKKATDHLNKLPQGEYREILNDITTKLLKRTL
ncbi:polyprenyl synthetase family protein [Saliterribacillus persicus]|uniref:Heptaprenyl diphosphate synthase n=1 Tax=Saliterribacillus persicus TaxID=930114 RepID=A0A368XVB8_9BACI|nr:polyprenyl synthetase family protein [Saliterribacillus persicus]RCW71902.1 heptaprenyl diphosphate synthase [Saliterribacillus persicus]